MGGAAVRWLIRGAAVAIVLVAAGVAWWIVAARPQSDAILEPWAEIGGERWLRPDLRRAKVVMPDRPNAPDEARQGGKIGRTRSYRLTTNSHRLRGAEIGPKAGRRLLALGASVTHGWGVADGETYPEQLEQELQRRGQEVEVINAGVPSIGTHTMVAWCRSQAPALAPDVLLWTRRPTAPGGTGMNDFVREVRSCRDALGGIPTWIVLPPISQFDLRASETWRGEREQLLASLPGFGVIELTEVFRAAQAGKGESLRRQGGKVQVVDQESGTVWVEGAVTDRGLDPAIYALFEREDSVREALFFDDGHPDAEGFVLFAKTVADALSEPNTSQVPSPPPHAPPR